MVTGQSHCRNFRRLTNESSRQWMPTKMAASLWRRCRPSCREPGDRFRGSRAFQDRSLNPQPSFASGSIAKATSISLLVVIGVRADDRKVLHAVKNMGGEHRSLAHRPRRPRLSLAARPPYDGERLKDGWDTERCRMAEHRAR